MTTYLRLSAGDISIRVPANERSKTNTPLKFLWSGQTDSEIVTANSMGTDTNAVLTKLLLASSGQMAALQLNISPCTGHLTTKNFPAQMLTVPKVEKPCYWPIKYNLGVIFSKGRRSKWEPFISTCQYVLESIWTRVRYCFLQVHIS